MKIQTLGIDGYGVWSGLRIEGFSDGLNVLFGPNEAGKTTLLQFVRSMLYGFTHARENYFPPVHGGQPGGRLDVESAVGRYEIARHLLANGPGEDVVLTTPDGMRQGEHLVKAMLSEVDEAVFNNVFAVELREMQELGALSDTDAAAMLYKLTAGLDRVSLVVVLKELAASRRRLLDEAGNPSRLTQLSAEHEQRRLEIEELGGLGRRFQTLAAQRAQLDAELTRLEEERNRAGRQVRLHELARTLRERWQERRAADEQLAALGLVAPMPDNALQRLETLNAHAQTHRQQIEQLDAERKALLREAEELKINAALRRHAARIEAVLEQEPWLTGLQNQLRELKTEIARLERDLNAETDRLGISHILPDQSAASEGGREKGEWGGLNILRAGPTSAPATPNSSSLISPSFTSGAEDGPAHFSPRTLSALRGSAKTLSRARRNLEQAKSDCAQSNQTVETLKGQLREELKNRGETDLQPAMDRAGGLVAQFRRRQQTGERLEQLIQYQKDLESQTRVSIGRQLLPGWMLAVMGAVFVVSVMLILSGFILPNTITGSVGWATLLLGLGGGGAAIGGKILLEKSHARHHDSMQKQLLLLASQIEQGERERDDLDKQLPRGGGLSHRLEAAEKELAALEELVPLETRLSAARQESATAERRRVELRQEYKTTLRQWRRRLADLGLPADAKVKQLRLLVRRWPAVVETQRRLDALRDEARRRGQEWEHLTGRLLQVAADAEIALTGEDPGEHLKQLAAALTGHQAAITRHETIHEQLRTLRRRTLKHAEAVSRIKHRRRKLFFEAGVREEEEFRQRAVQHGRAEVLRRQREQLEADIAAALGKDFSEEAVRELLEGAPAADFDAREKSWTDRLAELETQVRQRLEQRGQLAVQLQLLIDDRRLPQKQLELGVLDCRIQETAHRWRVLAATNLALDRLRELYERERQPETLKEASLYFERMTRGRYARVWTPLDEPTLRVDDAQGQCLAVERLSRGTREQLFLSLRLALAAGYARRGAALPMVLDDVLVNFDTERAAATADVLRDFGAAGRQLLVFTCHEHIERLFANLGVPHGRLPSPAEGSSVIRFTMPTVQEFPSKPRPTLKRKPPARVKVVEEIPEPPLEPQPKPAPKRAAVFDADFFDARPEEAESSDVIEKDAEEDQDINGPSNAEAA
jgi:uncharacterized protein YhaN